MIEVLIVILIISLWAFIYKWKSNPYTEEIISTTNVTTTNGETYKRLYVIKRTYANGATRIINRTENV